MGVNCADMTIAVDWDQKKCRNVTDIYKVLLLIIHLYYRKVVAMTI